MLKARDIRMPSTLRRLFATILVFCLPTGVRELWNEFYPYMVEDYPSMFDAIETCHTNKFLNDLEALLLQHGKNIMKYDFQFQLENVTMIQLYQDSYKMS